jgi:serine/threonine protein kinase
MVVHGDIRLENCLLDMTVPQADIDGGALLLCGFGKADHISDDRKVQSTTLSDFLRFQYEYAAPEMLTEIRPLVSPAADVWAFGVVLYGLLRGELPFSPTNSSIETMVQVQKGLWDAEMIRSAMHEQGQLFHTQNAIDLVKGCLTTNSATRWAVSDICNCLWLVRCGELHEIVSTP